MLFRQKELLRWLGVTVFETWFFLLCLTIFTVLLVLKVDGSLLSASTSWFLVFSPLFVSDGLNSYFCIIVFIRQYLDRDFKNALLRAIWSLLVIGLLFVFKFLLCNKLSDSSKLDYSEVIFSRLVLNLIHLI
jgi:ribonuclease P/MRP protein subunit RPP20